MKKIFFVLFISTIALHSFGQNNQTTNDKNTQSASDKKKQERKDRINNLIKREEEGALIYSKQSAFGFKAATDGWGASYEHGKYKTITKTNLWWAEIGGRKSANEEKISSEQDIGNGLILIGNPYVFGKINNFYYLKAGIGQQYLIGGKGNKNGIAVSAIYGGGVTLGYLKPYYINIDTVGNGDGVDIKYQESTATYFTDPSIITGSSGFTKGFGEGKFVPGAFARVALRFDYGRYNEMLSAIETGVNLEYYSQKMPIMLNSKDKQFFINAYVAIEFGRRK